MVNFRVIRMAMSTAREREMNPKRVSIQAHKITAQMTARRGHRTTIETNILPFTKVLLGVISPYSSPGRYRFF